MTNERKKELQAQCSWLRNQLTDLFHGTQTGHPGGSLSCAEAFTALYFEIMNVGPQNPVMEGRDRLVLSKGHTAPILYLVLAEKGFFPEEELENLRQAGSMLQEHPCVHKISGVKLSIDPLGLGLSAGLEMVLSARVKRQDFYTYMIVRDGEIQEGHVWEATISASKFKADHLVDFLDNNGVQLDGTLEKIVPMGDLRAKWEAFGWNVVLCDGHSVEGVYRTVKGAKAVSEEPSLILAKTVKDKGVSFMEGRNTWHGKAINDEEYAEVKTKLGGAL